MSKITKKLANNYKYLYFLALIAGLLTGWLIMNVSDNQTVHEVGDNIDSDRLSFIVNEAYIEDYTEPNSGAKLRYLVVDMSLTNSGDTTLPFIPVHQTYVSPTENEDRLDMSPLPTLTNPIDAGDVEPGSSVTGELSYLIDMSGNWQFIFEPASYVAEPIIVNVIK